MIACAQIDPCYHSRPAMTRIIIDKVVQSDITITEWLRSLSFQALDQIASKSPSANIRELARKEQRDRLFAARSAGIA